MTGNGNGDRRQTRHKQVALWAGVAAFCTNVVAFKLVAAVANGDLQVGLSALLASLAVAGAVYAKERLNAARKEELDAARREMPPGEWPTDFRRGP